ncbi:26S proteasome subunit RPN7-domain-containing protein [Crucibulum laeve]|uniref:26S proteasome subunit RPN7-domain-containing protein n=1 Tax=Crucibulum laeve TaxID=68775 RepID=A0A5C3LY89_9AGAR|nr:26S proteasome subunit RPN7-domain-containing protein [Crucibulum laeve]
MADEVVLPIPNLGLPQNLFTLSQPSLAHLHDKAREELIAGIKADEMGPYYRSITAALPTSPSLSKSPSLPPKSPSPSASSSILPLDAELLASMEAANKAQLEKLDVRLEEAEKIEGETEISEALRARADYLTRIGDKERALPAQLLALEKTPGLGARIDIVLTIVRIGFFFGDNELVTGYMKKAEALIDEGGDWDRRNRLKVYNGLHLVSIRQFKRAGELLLDALSTFTAVELIAYNDFVALTVIAGALTLGRVELKKKLIASPEVNQVLPDIPVLGDLVKSLYDCHYDKFFVALATLEQTHLIPSRILSPHARFYVREMRILAYSQLLESYRSLTIQSLSAAFGVSGEFVDSELSRFIASGRLHATIDKVNGIVETTRPSLKNAQYEQVVKQGDVLLNEVQRLSKVLY